MKESPSNKDSQIQTLTTYARQMKFLQQVNMKER